MENKVNLTAKDILNKKFCKDVKGYDPNEVDAFLDEIIGDYQRFAAILKEKDTKILSLEKELSEFKESNNNANKENDLRYYVEQLEIENASLKNRLEGIKPSDKVTTDNLEWIQKCRKLEEFLYNHGFSETDLK